MHRKPLMLLGLHRYFSFDSPSHSPFMVPERFDHLSPVFWLNKYDDDVTDTLMYSDTL